MTQCNSTEFYIQGSFVDIKQNTFCLLSTLQSLVLQIEQYPPIASTQVLKSLKCIEIITSVRQSTDSYKILPVLSYTTSMGIFQVASFPGSCAQVTSLCKLIGGAQVETPEFNCLRPPNVTRLFSRGSPT